MANKREFKKYAEAVGASAIEAMTDTYYNVKGVDKDAVAKAIQQVLGAVGAAQSHSNVFFDKGRKAFANAEEYSKAKTDFFKKLFEKIYDDFGKEIDEALKTFNAAIPADAKAENKKAVAE